MNTQQLAQKLVQFRSTHSHMDQMRACLDYCIDYFQEDNLIIKKYESGGKPSVVISNTDNENVDVILLGHIDTVDGADELFKGTIKDGKLYGRGSMDMKAFVATSMQVVKRLVAQDFSGTFALMIVSDEELGGVYGARYLVQDIGYTAKVVLVPDDGDDITHIIEETKHILHLSFKAKGIEAHANRPWDGVNAIEKLITVYTALRTHFGDFTTVPDDIWVNTINLGKISGGVATNEVPGEATMTVDIRFVDGTTKEEVLQWIEGALIDGVTYQVDMEGYPTKLKQDNPLVTVYKGIVEKETGKQVRFIKAGGGTDARYFSQKGMLTIVHQSNGGSAQGDNEHVELDGLDVLVNIQTQFIIENFNK